jgi:hypothetical protein
MSALGSSGNGDTGKPRACHKEEAKTAATQRFAHDERDMNKPW